MKWLIPVVITAVGAFIAILTFRATRTKWRKEMPDLSVRRFEPKHETFERQIYLGTDARGHHYERRLGERGVIKLRINNAGGTDVTVSHIRVFVPTNGSMGYGGTYDGPRILARDHADYRLDFTGTMKALRKEELEGWDRVAARWRKVTVALISADGEKRTYEVGWTVRDMIDWARGTQS